MNCDTRFADEMTDELRHYYINNIGVIKSGISKVFPPTVTEYWKNEYMQGEWNDIPDVVIQSQILDPVWLYLNRGGKCLRSVIAAICMAAYGKDPQDYITFLSMIEVAEDATIIYDDVDDDSDVRRGGESCHVVYGIPTAFNSSISVFDYCYHLLLSQTLPITEKMRLSILDVFTWEAARMGLGQGIELQWALDGAQSVNDEYYYQETISRCAFLSFRGPIQMASIIGEAPSQDTKVLAEFGELLGMAYHLHGDYLNLNSDEEEFGKTWAEDITGSRRTLLVNYTIKHASGHVRKRFLQILDSHTEKLEDKLDAVNIMKSCGSFDHLQSKIQEFIDRASQKITDLSVSPYFQNLLQDYVHFCAISRTK